MKYIALIIFITILSCKKVKQPDFSLPEPTERVKLLTSHNWAMTHEYSDTTAYAKANLNLWPLSTTEDYIDKYDTCSWDSKNVFLIDGNWKLIKSKACDPSLSENVGHWKLTNNDNDFEISGQGTMHIVELTNSYFKMYYESNTYYQQQLILTEYRMWVFEAR